MGSKTEKETGMTDPKRVVIDGSLVKRYAENLQKEYELEVPELGGILNFDPGEVPILKVRMASLDDHIKAQKLASAPAQLLYKIAEKINNGEDVTIDDVITTSEGIDPKTYFELELFCRCVIDPKFEMFDVIKISEALPDFINRVVSYIIGLNTNGSTT